MKALDDSDRAKYRADLLRQVVRERFGRVPWCELNAKPLPRPQRLVRRTYSNRAIATHRSILNRYVTDPIDLGAERAA